MMPVDPPVPPHRPVGGSEGDHRAPFAIFGTVPAVAASTGTSLPFTLRIPTNRADNPDGAALNRGTGHVDVQVIHDPAIDKRGECRNGYGGPVIALREWDEQVFLHELLHAVTAYAHPLLTTTYPPHGHEVISRIEVALWESGWRWLSGSQRPAHPLAASTGASEDVETLVEALTYDEPKPLDDQFHEGCREIARLVLASDWFAAREAAARAEERERIARAIEATDPNAGPGFRAAYNRAARIAREVRP